MGTRQTLSPSPVCWWCKTSTEPETGFRGYDPNDEVMAEFGATVTAIVCAPSCPARPDGAVVVAAKAMVLA